MNKHTPGPWRSISECADWGMRKQIEIYAVEKPTDERDCIAIVPSIQPYCMGAKEEDKKYARTQAANARLIAAAPDLLEALKSALKNDCNWEHKAEAAIARAKG